MITIGYKVTNVNYLFSVITVTVPLTLLLILSIVSILSLPNVDCYSLTSLMVSYQIYFDFPTNKNLNLNIFKENR